jgi:hypothetical protein
MVLSERTSSGFAIFGIIALVLVGVGILSFIIYKFRDSIFIFLSSPFTFIINFFLNFFKNNSPLIGKDNCALIQGTNLPVSRVPSTYLAHVIFFFAFLFTNAYTVYNLPKEPSASNDIYENRRNRSAMIMALLVLLYIILVSVRSNITGCESYYGVTFTTVAFGALGYGFYKLAEICGARHSDILGISTMFVSENATKPVVCV